MEALTTENLVRVILVPPRQEFRLAVVTVVGPTYRVSSLSSDHGCTNAATGKPLLGRLVLRRHRFWDGNKRSVTNLTQEKMLVQTQQEEASNDVWRTLVFPGPQIT